MDINAANMDMLFRTMNARFNKAFGAAPSMWKEVASGIPSTARSNRYYWANYWPKMKLFTGEPMFEKFVGYSDTVENKRYSAFIKVMADDIRDDQLNILESAISDSGYSAKQWEDELLAAVIDAAFTSACYDGEAFYSADHPVNINGVDDVASNLMTKALSATTVAAAKASFETAYMIMRQMKDDQNRNIGLRPTVLMVPTALEPTGKVLMESAYLYGDDQALIPNPYKGWCKLVVNDRLASDTAWFLLDTSRPVKPFIVQTREKVRLTAMIKPDDPNVFNQEEFQYKITGRGAASYSHWQMTVGSTGLT